ncbi:MAG: efflux RND transporter periplasmic adaptor subunit, partial [Rhodothermales bacterium]|nr:efflux RND transporter periplasmic adaptor subunit [Rhodothermales bacterium]
PTNLDRTAVASESGDDERQQDVVHLTAAESEEFGIVLETAGPGEMRVEKTYPGEIRVNEDRYAHVTPRVPGVVRSVYASLGERVQVGGMMAVLESRELTDIKSGYLAAVERVDLALANFQREERLFEKKISSEQEYLEARQTLAQKRIEVRSAEQKLRALGFSEAYIEELPEESETSLTLYPLTAPFTGTVIEKHIALGEALEADTEAFEVADLSDVWVDLSVYQRDMGLIQEGQEVVISAGDHQERDTISYVRPIVGENTRTAMARVVLPNPHGRWKPGMFVNGLISVDAREAPIVVPKSALQTINGQSVIFVRTEEGFIPRPVTVAEENSDQVSIATGLTQGETYVSAGGFALKSELQKSELSAGDAD